MINYQSLFSSTVYYNTSRTKTSFNKKLKTSEQNVSIKIEKSEKDIYDKTKCLA